MSVTEAPVDVKPAAAPVADACPACGSGGNVLFTVTLDWTVDGGYRADHFGVVPEQGDTLTRCEECAAFFVHADDGTALGAPDPAPAPEPAPAVETPAVETPAVAPVVETPAAVEPPAAEPLPPAAEKPAWAAGPGEPPATL